MPKKKRDDQEDEDIRFSDLPLDLQDLLREMSMKGYIYLGRNGCGYTRSFRRAAMEKGTWKAIEEIAGYDGVETKAILEAIDRLQVLFIPRILEALKSI